MLTYARRPAVRFGRLRQVPRAVAARRDGGVTLYSDLLLHDMGPALDDKIVQGDATGADWRTTPLVGLRPRERFLHDGRADHAARCRARAWRRGAIVRDRFFRLDDSEQEGCTAISAASEVGR